MPPSIPSMQRGSQSACTNLSKPTRAPVLSKSNRTFSPQGFTLHSSSQGKPTSSLRQYSSDSPYTLLAASSNSPAIKSFASDKYKSPVLDHSTPNGIKHRSKQAGKKPSSSRRGRKSRPEPTSSTPENDLFTRIRNAALLPLERALSYATPPPLPKTTAQLDLFETEDSDLYHSLAEEFEAGTRLNRATSQAAESEASAGVVKQDGLTKSLPSRLAVGELALCHHMLDSVKAERWSSAREHFTTLFDAGQGANEDPVYINAAVESLISPELKSSEERLDWFIHWYSLIPAWSVPGMDYQTPAFVVHNERLLQLLFDHPRALSHLSRILILFAQKGYASFFGDRLLQHLVRFGPPTEAVALAQAMSNAAGWDTEDPRRTKALNVVIRMLIHAGYIEAAFQAIKHVRQTQPPYFSSGYLVPVVTQINYQNLRRSLLRLYNSKDHPVVVELAQLYSKDYIDRPLEDSDLRVLTPPPFIRLEPTPETLAKTIRTHINPNTGTSATGLSKILRTLYNLEPPRPRLQALLRNRIINKMQYRTVDESIAETAYRRNRPSQENGWLRAEMLAMTVSKQWDDIVRLFGARYMWIGVPTNSRWDAYRQRDAEMFANPPGASSGMDQAIVGERVQDVVRNILPSDVDRGIVVRAMVGLCESEGELEELYQSYLDNIDFDPVSVSSTASASSASSSPISSEQTSSSTTLVATSTNSTRLTPWSSPTYQFSFAPLDITKVRAFTPFISAFARTSSPERIYSILSDMWTRGIQPDAQQWLLILVSLVHARRYEDALVGLTKLEKEGGIQRKRLSKPNQLLSDTLEQYERLSAGQRARAAGKGKAGVNPLPSLPALPKVYGDIYVVLIYELALLHNLTYGQAFEDKLRASQVELTEFDRENLAKVYVYRYCSAVAAYQRFGTDSMSATRGRDTAMPKFVKSPWGHPNWQDGSLSWYDFDPTDVITADPVRHPDALRRMIRNRVAPPQLAPSSSSSSSSPAPASTSESSPSSSNPYIVLLDDKVTKSPARVDIPVRLPTIEITKDERAPTKWGNTSLDEGTPLYARWQALRTEQRQAIEEKERKEETEKWEARKAMWEQEVVEDRASDEDLERSWREAGRQQH